VIPALVYHASESHLLLSLPFSISTYRKVKTHDSTTYPDTLAFLIDQQFLLPTDPSI
jgi:hypothetical protein